MRRNRLKKKMDRIELKRRQSHEESVDLSRNEEEWVVKYDSENLEYVVTKKDRNRRVNINPLKRNRGIPELFDLNIKDQEEDINDEWCWAVFKVLVICVYILGIFGLVVIHVHQCKLHWI